MPPSSRARCFIHTIKAFEQPRLVAFRNADAGILDIDADLFASHRPTDSDSTTGGRVLHRVVHEIVENRVERFFVHVRGEGAGRGTGIQPLILRLGPRPMALEAVVDDRGQGNGPHIEGRRSGLYLGEAQQVDDQVMQSVGLLVDLGEESAAGGRVSGRSIQKCLGTHFNDGQRRLQTRG